MMQRTNPASSAAVRWPNSGLSIGSNCRRVSAIRGHRTAGVWWKPLLGFAVLLPWAVAGYGQAPEADIGDTPIEGTPQQSLPAPQAQQDLSQRKAGLLQVKDHGLIYDATTRPAHERIAFFTSLCTLRSGAIVAAFQVGSGKHAPDSTLRVCRASDGSRTWAELPCRFQTTLGNVPGSLSAPGLVETEPGRLLLLATWFDRHDPAKPLFDPVTGGIQHSKLLLAESKDGGETWSPWRELPTPGLTGCASTGPIVQWPDGTLACAFESFKEFDDPRPARHGAWLVVSKDGGRTFSEPRLVAQHPQHKIYYWDQRLCVGRAAGELVALFWTHDLEHKRDLHVSLRRGWLEEGRIRAEPIRETTIPGQIAAPLVLEDGRLLAFVVDRDRPGTMTLWSSRDGGQSWPAEDRLVVHVHDERAAVTQGKENIDFKKYWEDMGKWSFGHPALVPLGQDLILAAFYAGTPEAMSIHWARVSTR